MNMIFYRKLPIPQDIKASYPLSENAVQMRDAQLKEMKDILSGISNKWLIVVGPCSADDPDAVMVYLERLARLREQVGDKLLLVPRIYTNKPRTKGDGYMGMLHQPDPSEAPDLLKGIVAIRKLHMRALEETGFAAADELLYPEDHRYLSDILSYVAIGARSVEDQQHRLVASGLDIPVGMKNPTGGSLQVMLNSILAAQHGHMFLYRGWEVESQGNPFAHGVLRGEVDRYGVYHPNYDTDTLLSLSLMYMASGAKHPAILVDTNHANSGKAWEKQVDIAKAVMASHHAHTDVATLVKGLMIESYLEDGATTPGEAHPFGQSITDPCLGWKKTEKLLLELADSL